MEQEDGTQPAQGQNGWLRAYLEGIDRKVDGLTGDVKAMRCDIASLKEDRAEAAGEAKARRRFVDTVREWGAALVSAGLAGFTIWKGSH